MRNRSIVFLLAMVSSSSANASLCEKLLSRLSRVRSAPSTISVPTENSRPIKRWISEDGQTYQVFLANDPYNSYFDVRARLTDHGILHLYLITRDRNGYPTAPFTGSNAFQEIMDFFGARVRAFVSHWSWGTNLAKVNELTSDPNVSLEAAVQQTWAARQASKFGFSKAEVVAFAGQPGNYEGATVVFSRPESPVLWKDIPKDERSADFLFEE